jgi:hypothetical protein
MNPVELVTACLSKDERMIVGPVSEAKETNPFVRHRLFVIRGGPGHFDFISLPSGTFGYFVANSLTATRLTRQGKEIELVLADEWDDLPTMDPVKLASLILMYLAPDYHTVLLDSSELSRYGQLDEQEFAMLPGIGATQAYRFGKVVNVHAITLWGSLRERRNLGIERFAINSAGHVEFEERKVLSEKLFLDGDRDIWVGPVV